MKTNALARHHQVERPLSVCFPAALKQGAASGATYLWWSPGFTNPIQTVEKIMDVRHTPMYLPLLAVLGLTVLAGCTNDAAQSGEALPESTGPQNASTPMEQVSERSMSSEMDPENSPDKTAHTDAYGLPAEDYEITTHRIRYGQTLASILGRYGIDRSTVHELTRDTEAFDVRRLNSGRNLRFYLSGDQVARYAVYELNETEYAVFDLDPGQPRIYREEKPVTTERRMVSGQVNQSLYMSLNSNGSDTDLAFELSEILGWQIDFFHLQPGDAYRVVYDERLIDGEPAGIDQIQAVWFRHRGEAYYGVYFEQDGSGEFFDMSGNSLRKEFLRAPLQYSRISSGFTHNRRHPVHNRNVPHYGTDYAAPRGTPVRAVADGQIIRSRYGQNNGYFVRIRHGSSYETGYLHLSGFASGIREGTHVEQGDVIGYVGSTGLSTGPHLCYRFWVNGRPVDPYQMEFPPSEPVKEEYRDTFESRRIAKYWTLHQVDDPQQGGESNLFASGSPVNSASVQDQPVVLN